MATTSAPAVSDLASRLRFAIARTARRLRQEALASEDAGELSPTLTAALATVVRHGPLTPSELAERERVRRPTATRVIARLEDHALAERTRDPSDGRAYLVTATPDGRALIDRLRRRKDLYLARRMRDLDPDDLAALERATDVLERLLEEREGA